MRKSANMPALKDLRTAVAAVSLILLCGNTLTRAERPKVESLPGELQLWFMNHSYLTSEDALVASKKRIDEAAAYGYNGVILWDSGFNFMSDDFWPWENEARLGELMHYAAKKGMRTMATPVPYGNSNEALSANPNWAESMRVQGALFQVDLSGKQLVLKDSFPGLKNEIGRASCRERV